MNNTPRVSIVIPVYNGSNYLSQAIESALAQTYPNVEIIVVNDGSNDGGKSAEIARSFGDRIRYFEKPNGGVSSALNLGLREMTGEYFSWLSHDDLFDAEKTAEQIRFLSESSGALATVCGIRIIDGNGRRVREIPRRVPRFMRGGQGFWQGRLYACAILVHRSCFEKLHGFNEADRTAQDVEFILHLLHHFGIYGQNKVLVTQRDHMANGTHQLGTGVLNANCEELILRLVKQHSISFYFPKVNELDARSMAQEYNRLGEICSRSGFFKASNYCYMTSRMKDPSILNPTAIKLAVFQSVPSVERLYGLTLKVRGRLVELFGIN